MSNANDLVKRFKSFINDSCVDCNEIVIDDATYIVTTGTGEGNFAYTIEEFESGVEAAEEVEKEAYSAFCEYAEPVSNNSKVATIIYEKLGIRIYNPGICTPMY